jgi:hypothetical protein
MVRSNPPIALDYYRIRDTKIVSSLQAIFFGFGSPELHLTNRAFSRPADMPTPLQNTFWACASVARATCGDAALDIRTTLPTIYLHIPFSCPCKPAGRFPRRRCDL